jgi:predicted HTH domain antitoxin
MEEIERIVFNFPPFKDYHEKERFLKVVGLLVSHQVTFEKDAQLLGMKIEELAFLLDKLSIEYSLLDEKEAELEIEELKKVKEELRVSGYHFGDER